MPDFYIKVETDAVHAYGGVLVLDCIASGGTWPYAGMVMMSEAEMAAVKANQSNSFAMDLGKLLSVMEACENGGHKYDATMPTDALTAFHYTVIETQAYGFEKLAAAQW